MATILIVYHSQSGNTQKMAETLAAGASSVERTAVKLRKAAQASLEDLRDCDGLALGSPEYFGYMAGMIKDFFDRTYLAAQSNPKDFRKPYVLFVSAGNDGRNCRDQIERIATGFRFRKVYDPIVARGEISQDILDQCYEMGQTIAAGCDLGIY